MKKKMKNDRIFILRESIVIIAQMLSGNSIKVTQRGVSAYVTPDAEGKPVVINLPFIPDNATEELCDAIQGFLDHEVAHVLFTDFKAFNAIAHNPPLHNLANILEDARIEKAMAEKFQGCGSNLSNTGQFFLKKYTIPKMQEADSSGDKDAMCAVVSVPLIRSMAGQRIFGEFMRGKEHHVEEFYDKIKDLQPDIAGMKSTEDAINIAKEIRKRLGSEEEEEEGGPGKGGSSGGGKGKGKGKGKSGGGKSGGGGTPGTPGGEEEEPGGAGGAGAGEEEEEGEEEGTPGEPEEDETNWDDDEDQEGEASEPQAMLAALDKESANGFDEEMSRQIGVDSAKAAKHSEYLVYTTEDDVIEPLHVGAEYRDSMFSSLEDKVSHMVGPMQKDLERAIVARSRATFSGGHRSGRLHGAGLSKLVVGDERVFRRKEENTTKDVAGSLVVDISGSMGGSKIHLAAQAAYAVCQVLDRLKISNEVICFTTGPKIGGGAGLMEAEESRMGRKFTRTESLYMPVVKGFGERITTEIKRRFGWLPNNRLMRNNVDGESIEVAARRLLARPEAGKFMIVLSDGSPACAGDMGRATQHLKRVIKDLINCGINVIGIGIQDDSVKDYYPKYIVINDVDELPARVVGELRHMLLPK